jgi:hypothetical protein
MGHPDEIGGVGTYDDPYVASSFMAGTDPLNGGVRLTIEIDSPGDTVTYSLRPLMAAQLAAFMVTAVEVLEVADEVRRANIGDDEANVYWNDIPSHGHDDDDVDDRSK